MLMTVLTPLCGLFAVDGVLNKPEGNNLQWFNAANWQDVSGGALNAYPCRSDDSAHIVCESNMLRYVLFSPRNSDSTAFALSRITGGAMHVLQFWDEQARTYPNQRLTLSDPSGFPGWWGTSDKFGNNELVLDPADGSKSVLSGLVLNGRMGVNVPDVSATAEISKVAGDGMLYLTGSGKVRVGASPGSESRLIATGGTVEIAGVDQDDDVDSLVAGAALHFDPSDSSTLDTYVGSDGYEHVWRWRSVDATVAATTNDIPPAGELTVNYCAAPILCPEAISPSGLRMVDFGDRAGDTPLAEMRLTNCYLRLSKSCLTAREVFFVGQDVRPAGGGNTYFGGAASEDYAFQGGSRDGGLLTSSAHPDLRWGGDLRINNQRVTYANMWATRYGEDRTSTFVGSMSFRDDAETSGRIDLLGSCRYYVSRTGNVRMGEFLVFTNKLTASQRTRINDYLMHKWLVGHEREDFGMVLVGGSERDAAIEVPSGRVARVGSVVVGGSRLLKRGEGVLSIGDLTPANAQIDVQGGAVKLRAARVVSSEQPASKPYCWLDADELSTIVTGKVNQPKHDANVDYVWRWNDKRPEGTVYAEVPLEAEWPKYSWYSPMYPKIVENACRGHRAVDFGVNDGSQAGHPSWMWLQPHGDAAGNAYEGFIAFRRNYNIGANIFGSTGTELLLGASAKLKLANVTYGGGGPASAVWTWDGKVQDPWLDDAEHDDTRSFHVVSFSSAKKLRADLLAKDRLASANFPGDLQIGEFIIYDRRLTPQERRETIAYLMKKWLDRDLPSTSCAAPSFAFAKDTPIQVDVDYDLRTETVSGGNGKLVKAGSGTVEIVDASVFTNLTSVMVDEGALIMDLELFKRSAVYHFDALDLESLTCADGEKRGKPVTNVTHWVDCRRNGVFAHSSQSAADFITDGTYGVPSKPTAEDPTLQYVETRNGVVRPTLDFGSVGVYSADGSNNDGSAMQLCQVFKNIREVHTIFSDNNYLRRGIVVGCRGNDEKSYGFARPTSGAAHFAGIAQAAAKNGYIAVDGVECAYTDQIPEGFHLVSYAPTSDLWAGSIAQDRTSQSGGARVSEQIAFSDTLSDVDREYMQKTMMAKWFGEQMPVRHEFDELIVASDAKLSLGSCVVSACCLSGGGEMAVGEIRGVERIVCKGVESSLNVSGAVAFADDAIEIEFLETLDHVDPGVYTIFEAESILNSSPLNITVVGTGSRRQCSVRQVGNRILLTVARSGMAIIVR